MMNKILQESGYKLNQDIGVWAMPNYVSIKYSDGDDTEKRIADVIAKSDDISVLSTELLANCVDWPSTYHLSSNRANLLRPLAELFSPGRDVLEIGAGCGAITRYLGECGANVLALEGTVRRAQIARSRTRNLANVSVLAEHFNEFKVAQKFDVITLIGVLEYSNLYVKDKNPVDAVLAKVKKLLKPNGVLIIAIENQLGLKYFAGSPEDHVGVPMYGIEDCYTDSSVITFGKAELTSKISSAGMPHQAWWYPFPDYKLPTALVSEQVLKSADICQKMNSLISSSFDADPQMPRSPFFAMDRVWNTLSRNGLASDFSNSFLIVAGSNTASIFLKSKDVAYHYATTRLPSFAKQIGFEVAQDGNVLLNEALLQPGAKLEKMSSPLQMKLDVDRCFIEGVTWTQQLKADLFKEDWNQKTIELWARVWLKELLKLANINSEGVNAKTLVSGELIDAIPQNLILTKSNALVFIDQEWIFSDNLELGFLVYRGILGSIGKIGAILPTTEKIELETRKLVSNIMGELGFEATSKMIAEYDVKERYFQELATGVSRRGGEASEYRRTDTLHLGVARKSFPHIMDEVASIPELKTTIQNHIKLTQSIYATLSWKITKPLRFLNRLKK